MTITLDENDLLTHQLYTASKSPTVNRNRRKSWLMVTLIFLALALVCYVVENSTLAIYFLILSAISLVFYPIYLRRHYKQHYLKHIREHYKGRIEEPCVIEFRDDVIYQSSKAGEGTIKVSEIEAVNEISDYYFLKLSIGSSLIIPKKKCGDLRKVEEAIHALVSSGGQGAGIPHNRELDWKWR